MMVAALEKELSDIEPVLVDSDTLTNFTSEEDFLGLAVDLLVEVGSYVCVAASVLPGRMGCWNRDQAIVGGNVVRLFKLISALLDQTCQRRRETTFLIGRLAFETIVNIRYLVTFASIELFDSYVRYSLRHERKLLDRIHKNIQSHGGEEQPIERRMLNSIERTARASDVDIADLTSKSPNIWGDKNLFERAGAVGLADAYLGAFGGGSHSIHGSWMDLLDYHVEKTELGFQPQLEWQSPRPQNLLMIALLATETISNYFSFIGGEEVVLITEPVLAKLWHRIKQTDQAHEMFLTSRMTNRPEA